MLGEYRMRGRPATDAACTDGIGTIHVSIIVSAFCAPDVFSAADLVAGCVPALDFAGMDACGGRAYVWAAAARDCGSINVDLYVNFEYPVHEPLGARVSQSHPVSAGLYCPPILLLAQPFLGVPQ